MIMLDTTIVNVASGHAPQQSACHVEPDRLGQQRLPAHLRRPLLLNRTAWRPAGPQTDVTWPASPYSTAASLWCALSGTPELLIHGACGAGAGAACMGPQTMAFIATLVPAGQAGRADGMWGAVAGVARSPVRLRAGLLVDNLGWQWIFNVTCRSACSALVLD